MSKIRIFLFATSAAIFGAVMAGVLKPDSPVEEVTEVALEKETGVDLDLSPNSGDKY